MKLVSNPSYKHSPELIMEFKRYSSSIYLKDYTQYSDELIKIVLNAVIECKRIGIKSKNILWLTKQIYHFGLSEDMVREDYLPLVKFHSNNQSLLKPIESYSDMFELNTDIESLGKEDETVSEKDLDIFFEKDGWILAMPHTTKASCLLGKDTGWCTARTKSQNLFLSYVGRYEDDIVLFYLIRMNGNPKKNPNDKLSVGFKNGKPVFDGNDGGSTVNASNKGIVIERFGEILGKELAQIMLIKMDEKSQSIKGKHPAKLEMEKIAKSTDRYLKKISEFKNEDELLAFKQEIVKYHLNRGIQFILMNEKDSFIREQLIKNPSLIEEFQIKFAYDQYKWARVSLAENINLIKSIQIRLSNDEAEEVLESLAGNNNLLESTQLKLAESKNKRIKTYLAQNKNLSESTQLKLADDDYLWIRMFLAENRNIAQSAQNKLADDREKRVKIYLAYNKFISEATQLKLADDEEEGVRVALTKNGNLFRSVRLKLHNDASQRVKDALEENYVKNNLKEK